MSDLYGVSKTDKCSCRGGGYVQMVHAFVFWVYWLGEGKGAHTTLVKGIAIGLLAIFGLLRAV